MGNSIADKSVFTNWSEEKTSLIQDPTIGEDGKNHFMAISFLAMNNNQSNYGHSQQGVLLQKLQPNPDTTVVKEI